MARKSTTRKKSRSRKPSRAYRTTPKSAIKRKVASKKKPAARRKHGRSSQKVRGKAAGVELVSYEQHGLGARSGGQSGDTQGLAGGPRVDSESVEELLEEGQSYEAEVINGVENAPDPDQDEVRTREVKADDVPEEYIEKD